MQPPWPAPVASAPVDATVGVPGSKSVTNRALVLAALSQGPSVLRSPLRSRDSALMVAGLRAMGVEIDDAGDDWVVTPGRLCGPATVDVGLAGTVMRFLPPLATLATGDVSFDGDPRARERPVRPVLDALTALGADITSSSGRLPLTVHGRGWLVGGSVAMDATQSSQMVSALLLAAPRFADGVEVHHTGESLPSAPHIAMTVDMLRAAGAIVEHADNYAWRVEPGPLHLGTVTVAPDLSNAAPFLAAAMVTGGRVTVTGWPSTAVHPGGHLLALLREMGATVAHDEDEETLTVSGDGEIRGIHADLHDAPELLTTIAALAALARTPSRLTGVAHARTHETDRIAALSKEINALGGDVIELPDGLSIEPKPLHGGLFATYDDHRMATAGALIGLRVPGVTVENVETTAKTLPGFVGLWAGMLG
jgi:3-phosphoshikimate 1-carboxyvinyltransferase